MARTIVDLDARGTVLDASERLAAAPADGDIALVVAAGAPLLRSGVFLDVLRTEVGPRRLSLVTTDVRARSVAASAHVPAYASLAALERHELDPTERLERARRAVVAPARPGVPTARPSLGRVAAIAASLTAAALIVAAVALPEATVIVAAEPQPIGPFDDIVVRGTTGGAADVTVRKIEQPITATVPGTPTGVRTENLYAKGSVELQNKTTSDVRVPKGSSFRTAEGAPFLSTEEVVLPRSVIVPPFEFFIGRKTVPIEAAIAGPTGNVTAGRITIGPDPDRYTVTNPQPTSGGDTRRIPIVRAEDYDAAVRKAPDALRIAGEAQLARWVRERPADLVVPQVLVRQTAVAPSNVDVVGKESFELTVSGVATAYVTSDADLRRAVAAKLRGSAETGNDVDDRSVAFDVKGVKAADDGVTWTITGRGQQMKRVDRAAIGRLLAGRMVRDAPSVLEAERFTLVRLDWVPAWWPLLPLLDARITVSSQ